MCDPLKNRHPFRPRPTSGEFILQKSVNSHFNPSTLANSASSRLSICINNLNVHLSSVQCNEKHVKRFSESTSCPTSFRALNKSDHMAFQLEEPILLEDLAPLPLAKDIQHLFSEGNGSNLIILWRESPSRPQAGVNRILSTHKWQIALPKNVVEILVLASGQQEVAAFELVTNVHRSWSQTSFFSHLSPQTDMVAYYQTLEQIPPGGDWNCQPPTNCQITNGRT